MRRLTILVILLVAPFTAPAGVILRILDAPSGTMPLAPYPVIGAVENVGPGNVLVPANQVSISVEAPDHTMRTVPDARGCLGYDNVVWLKPGERYLFMYNVGDVIAKAGVYRIQAELHSDGRCRAYLRGNEPFPVVPVFEEGSLPRIECWKGEASSEIAPASSTKPSSRLEEEALAYVLSVGGPGGTVARFSRAYPHLREAFPSTEYTYAAGFWCAATYGGGDPIAHLDEIQKLQPGSRLAPYARLERMLKLIERATAPGHQDPNLLPPIVPAELDLPPALREYLAQVLREAVAPATSVRGPAGVPASTP